VLDVHSLSTGGGFVSTPYLAFSGQPVLGGQFGTGMACEITRLWLPLAGAVGFVVNALATKPANTMEKMDACTVSFINLVTSGYFISELFRRLLQVGV
jgi:hypothetical protein